MLIKEQHAELNKANSIRKMVEDQNVEMTKQYNILNDAFKERDRLLNVVKARYDEEVRKLADLDRTNTANVNHAVKLEKQFEVQRK